MLICIKMMWESDLNGSGGVGAVFTLITLARPGAGLGEVNDKIIVYCCSTTITVLMQDCGLRH